MNRSDVPELAALAARWRNERAARSLASVFLVLCCTLLVTIVVFLFVPGELLSIPLLILSSAFLWIVAAAAILGSWFRKPDPARVALRADEVLSLPGHLAHLSAVHPPADIAWLESTRQQAGQRLASIDLAKQWPVIIPPCAFAWLGLAILLSAAMLWLGLDRTAIAAEEKLAREKAGAERVEAAEEMFEDWEKFIENTPDPELKKFFAEAMQLREAMESGDAMDAMSRLHETGQALDALAREIAAESIAAEAEAMAGALESFEGMSAMSAALRSGNFDMAAEEARALAEKLAADPEGSSALRRADTVSQMLADQSAAANQRGKQQLSEALGQLSKAAASASKEGEVSNSEMSEPSKSLGDQFAQEAARSQRTAALQTGRAQLEALHRRLADGAQDGLPFPSLSGSPGSQPGSMPGGSSGDQPGGQQAGTSPGGDPIGDQVDLAAPGVTQTLTGVATTGESETRVSTAASGTATAVAAGGAAAFATYEELSRRAVADESLPLAHRQTIRAYFERIRPADDNSQP